MYSTSHLLRIAKTISVGAIGSLSSLIVLGNTTDYYTNYHFVEHVLKMDTTFSSSRIHYRSLDNPINFHVGYVLIILMEILMSVCCLRGGWLLFKHLKSDSITFHASKNWAVLGITLGILIWFFGFEVIGGEWFAMWQSTSWNGLNSAERIVSFLILTLILLQHRDE
jgi:predicted small integral membrane protein